MKKDCEEAFCRLMYISPPITKDHPHYRDGKMFEAGHRAATARLAPVIEAAKALPHHNGQLEVLRKATFRGVADRIEAVTQALRDAGELKEG